MTISRDGQNGLIKGSTLGSVADSITYSTFGEPSRYTASVSGAPVFDVQYTRDNLGRITSKIETVSGVTNSYDYGYDATGRLSEVRKNGALTVSYGYDDNGNRITVNGATVGVYDNQDRLVQYGATTYSHTANGELQGKTSGGQTTSYIYDVLGNLKSAVLPDGTQIQYVVDGQNRRIGKKVNGVLAQAFLYEDQLRPVAELDGSGNVVSRFVYGTKTNVPEYMVKNGVTYRIITDHLGSPRLVVDAGSGAIVQQIEHDEFGNVLADTNPGFQPFGFAGGLYDQQTKLTRFGARDYDAETGKWTAKDPIRFNGGDANLYGYVLNDPVNWVDPRGLERKPGKTPPKNWPKPPNDVCGKKPKWDNRGFWDGKGRRLTWDDRSHGAGVDRGNGPQDGHWDDENSDDRWDRNGRPLPGSSDAKSDALTPETIASALGVSVTTYLIISEVSRLIPARNLIPVP